MAQAPGFNIENGFIKNKVVVISGGAHGIGAALVDACYQQGAFVCFGDKDQEAGQALAGRLNATNHPPRVIFICIDVTSYPSVLSLFQEALANYGRIDHAVSNAGIVEQGNWFDPNLTTTSIIQEPPTQVLDINLLGSLYFARIASVYLRENRRPGEDKSLVLVSSVSGFKESPGLFVYQASKHGVLGVMRALRNYVSKPTNHSIRVNAICPWMTETAMVSGVGKAWRKAGLPINHPTDVARVILRAMAQINLNGTSWYVEGGREWEIEQNIDRLQPQWLGTEPSASLEKGQVLLGDGLSWTSEQ